MTKTDTRTVTRTEYRPLAGQHVGYVTDVIVSASAGLPTQELARVEPFDLRQLRRFSPALVIGWIHEEFAVPAAACRDASRVTTSDRVGAQLRRYLPGDSHCDLVWRTTLDWESLDPILVPLWVFSVRYRGDRAPLRVVINGQSGTVGGKVPLSTPRLVAASLAFAALIAALAWWWATRGAS